jgi:hypothetical protein
MDTQKIGMCKGSDLGKGCWKEVGAGLAVLRWARGGGARRSYVFSYVFSI